MQIVKKKRNTIKLHSARYKLICNNVRQTLGTLISRLIFFYLMSINVLLLWVHSFFGFENKKSIVLGEFFSLFDV